MNNEKQNKLKMRDIITLSIFNIAMIVIMLVTKMCTMMLTTPAFGRANPFSIFDTNGTTLIPTMYLPFLQLQYL